MNWNPERLDVLAMAKAGGAMASRDRLEDYERLVDEAVASEGETAAEREIAWSAQAEMRTDAGAEEASPWLHLQVQAHIPLCCQRCLQAVDVELNVDRWFRFVADEAAAEAQDDESEEDVLALEPRPSLRTLIEDELLMAMPLVPLHEACPLPLPPSEMAGEPAREPEAKPNPFSVLAGLKR